MANFDITRSVQKKNELILLNSLQSINNCFAIQKSTQANFNHLGEFCNGQWDTKKINLLDHTQRVLKRKVASIHEAIDILTLMIDGVKRIKEILIEMKIKVSEEVSENPGTVQSEIVYDLIKHYLSQIDEITNDTQFTVRNTIRKTDITLLNDILTTSTGNELITDFFTHPFDSKFLSLDYMIVSFKNGNFHNVSDAIAVINAAITTTDSGISYITELRSHLIFKQETLSPPYNDVGIIDDSIMNDEKAREQLQLSKSLILNHTSVAVLVHTNMAPLLFRIFKN